MLVNFINLDRSVERRDSFECNNAHLREAERFPGVDGQELSREKLIFDSVIDKDLAYPNGTLGCALSHVALWRLAVEENRVVTIAEDDAILSYQFDATAERLLRRVHDEWDFVLWSASLKCYTWLDALPGGFGARLEFFPGDVLDNIQSFQAADSTPSLVRARYLLGLICYSVSPKGARALLDRCLPIRPMIIDFKGFGLRLQNDGIDCIINDVLPELKTYVCLPPLAISDEREESVRISRNSSRE